MTSLDAINGFAASRGRADEQNGETRHAAWLLQMERALLAANVVKVEPDHAGSPLPKESNSEAAPAKSNKADDAAGATGAALVLPVGALPTGEAKPAVAQANKVAADAAVPATQALSAHADPGVAARATSAPTSAVPADSAERAPNLAAAHTVATTVVSATAEPAIPATGAPGVADADNRVPPHATSVSLANYPDLPFDALAALAQVGALAAHAGNAPTGQPGNQPVQAIPPTASVRLAGIAPGWGGLPQLAAGEPGPSGDADLAPASERHAQLARQLEPYRERQIHLYQGPDGVQAWIRDAGLNPWQAQSVAQSLNQEFAAMGSRLKALTINGRKLEDSAYGDVAEEATRVAVDDAVRPF